MNEGCTNGRGLAALTPHNSSAHTLCRAGLQPRVRPSDFSSGMAEPFQASWETTLASGCLWTPCKNSVMRNSDSVPSIGVEITVEIPVGNSSEV